SVVPARHPRCVEGRRWAGRARAWPAAAQGVGVRGSGVRSHRRRCLAPRDRQRDPPRPRAARADDPGARVVGNAAGTPYARGQSMSELAAAFEEHRSHLRMVAHRMLGSAAEADDAVQEAWIKLTRADTSAVENLR